jgi:hypothetical protein
MKKLLTLLFLVAFASWSAFGAVATGYQWSMANGTYTPITGATVLGSGSGLDDNSYGAIPIGFTFFYNGNSFTQFGVSDNGFIILGGGAVPLTYGVFVPMTNPNAIAALSADLSAANASAKVSYSVSGSAPNRALTIQWDNFQRWGNAGTACNFQIKLFETTNTIQCVYGAFTGSATQYVGQVGISGNPASDYNIRAGYAQANSWATSIPSPGPNFGMPVMNTWFPASGLIYQWSEIAPGIAVNVSPTVGATGVAPTATLNWSAPTTGGVPNGYKLYFGTNNPPTNIVNGTNIGNVTSYDPTPDMALLTNYYWKVVPFNGGGDATGTSVWNFQTTIGYGNLTGYVLNCYGVPVQAATVSITGPATATTTSGLDGSYSFTNISAGTYTVAAQKAGFNTVSVPGVLVVASNTVSQNVTLTQPAMTVLPNPNNVTLSPNEFFNGAFTVTNAGCGPLTWTASIGSWSSGNHSWFSMPNLTGNVAASSNGSVTANFDATGLTVGTVQSAVVTFTSNPNVGSFTVPVSMTVSGAALANVSNLTGNLTNQFTGAVTLDWECTPGTGFLYYTVKRNGTQIAIVPSALTYNDVLPTYGSYTYEVAAIYTDGATAPASVVVEWPNPNMTWTPASLIATVWSGTSKAVPFSIGNTGQGTLSYQFPDYVDNSGDSPTAYCTASGSTSFEYINRVQIGTIDNSSGNVAYENFTAISTDLELNSTYPVTVTCGNPWGTDISAVWIDFNHNSVFDEPGEKFALAGSNPATGSTRRNHHARSHD